MSSEALTETEADLQPRNILVPIDFSPLSQKAIIYAQGFAEKFGSIVHLVHIVEPIPVVVGIDAAPVPPPISRQDLAKFERDLADLAKELPPGLVGRTIVREGWAVVEVISVAKELQIDLIIVPTHGHSGIQRVLFGSNAEGIIRKAPCAVLVVRPAEREFINRSNTPEKRVTFALKNSLVPVDFSDSSRAALGYAVTLARRFQAKLICLHVIEIIPTAEPEMSIVTEMELIRKSVFEATERTLQEFLKGQSAQIPRENVLTFGSASREIIEIAEDRKADLIVMGTHRKTGGARFLLGGTAERVVRHALCPVLVVREPKSEASPPKAAQRQQQLREAIA